MILWSQNLQNQQNLFKVGKHANRLLPDGDTVVELSPVFVLQVLIVL